MADRVPQSAVEALQGAVIARLKDDPVLKVLVAARIYDEVPSDKDRPKPPYVYLGGVNRRRMTEQGTCSAVRTVTFRLYAVSTEFGRLEAWSVIEACVEALDNKEIELAAPYTTLGEVVKLVSDGDVIQPVTPKSTFADFTIDLMKQGD
ncbi:DUF3168 domain-containing protein [Bradyrhizobium sp. BR 1433]|uniref:DUF3168 domain-containing protein n=1 Tax=Bradyrhizobium sp. BR 1433 TaxID=3447967 RepID=UPI003EE6B136